MVWQDRDKGESGVQFPYRYRVMLVDDEEEVRKSIIRKIDWTAVGFAVVGDAENGEIKFEDLQRNDIVGAMFARIKYFESGRKIPPSDDTAAQAKLYKEVYNTSAGRGDVSVFEKKKRAKLGASASSK